MFENWNGLAKLDGLSIVNDVALNSDWLDEPAKGITENTPAFKKLHLMN